MSETMRIKFVVINECMLGYTIPEQPHSIGILASSTIKGASHGWKDGPYPMPVNGDGIRPATRKDFALHQICPDGYEKDPRYDVPTEP